MTHRKRIIIVINSQFSSGAEYSITDFINSLIPEDVILVLPNGVEIINVNPLISIESLPMLGFYKTKNPLRILRYILSILFVSYSLAKIIRKNKIDLVYANSIKSLLYIVGLNLFISKKIIWHVRDRVDNRFLSRWLAKKCDQTISVSQYINEQLPNLVKEKRIVYGGIDLKIWSPTASNTEFIHRLNLPANYRLVGMAAQITRWKNIEDFIRAANLISAKLNDVYFIIIGDDLSGRERSYLNDLHQLVLSLNMKGKIKFIGFEHNIVSALNSISVLIHPAIGEPFGRVILEAMALEKPVVAYDSGGPSEIIINDESGYLVIPFDYNSLAERTIHLLENSILSQKFGVAGRQRVIEKFNVKRYLKDMTNALKQTKN